MAPVQIGVSDFRFFDIMRHVNNCYYAESKRWFRFGMKWRGLLRRNLGDAAFLDGFFVLLGLGCCGAPDGAGGGEASALYGGYGGGASGAGDQNSGGNGGNAWRIVGSTDGGAGGSGTTGTSDTSYVRIYKFG